MLSSVIQLKCSDWALHCSNYWVSRATFADGRIPRTISDMRLAPNDKPSDQENHWQKNRRSNSQPASEQASLDLRETSDRRDMGRINSPEPVKRQYSRDDAAVDKDIGNACLSSQSFITAGSDTPNFKPMHYTAAQGE